MKFTFPYMDLDTNLYPVLYASSQVEAGSPACYGTHKGFYMNAVGSEKEAAVLAVRKYKEYLINKIFLKESSIKNCRFNKYCCIAVIENGLVHIEFVIDNEIKLWEMLMDEEYDDFY